MTKIDLNKIINQSEDIQKIEKKILWNEFKKVSKKLLGKDYTITTQNEKVVYTLLRYFSGAENFNSDNIIKNKASLHKGILLFGDYGVGKTKLFEIFKEVGIRLYKKHPSFTRMRFKQISCGNFVQLFMTSSKYDHLNFNLPSYYKGKLFIDDLGAEQLAFNNYELMEQVIFERYRNQAKTYITSNLSPGEIGERYGARIDDRLPEMFNIIKWEGTSFREEM